MRIPRDLTVIVRVNIDPARRHDGAIRRDLLPARARLAADLAQPPIIDGDIAAEIFLPAPSTMAPPRMTRSCMPEYPFTSDGSNIAPHSPS